MTSRGGDDNEPALIDGFTVTRGLALSSGGGGFQTGGDEGETYIRRCIFSHNEAATMGGAIAVSESGGVAIDRTVFLNNRAIGGGAISFSIWGAGLISNSLFIGNLALQWLKLKRFDLD